MLWWVISQAYDYVETVKFLHGPFLLYLYGYGNIDNQALY